MSILDKLSLRIPSFYNFSYLFFKDAAATGACNGFASTSAISGTTPSFWSILF